jgi:signal transduction histidine kinase
MKSSLKFKLFTHMVYLIAFFVLVSWILNTQYLEKYYVFQKQETLVNSFATINRSYRGAPEDIALEAERIERMDGLKITIYGQDDQLKYSSSPWDLGPRGEGREPRLAPRPGAVPPGNREDLIADGEDYVIYTSEDPRLKTKSLNLRAELDNGDYLLLSTPLAVMAESADIANQFFLIIGIITMSLGSIAAYFCAKKFTRPVQELNAIAQGMAGLDFSKKYDVTSQDEIGELGCSINSLSDQLDKSITELQEANRKLRQDIERERQVDEMRKEFISNVSHELKTPIALIQGYAEGLKENVNEDEANKNFYCDVITDETAKMDKMVRQLLDLSLIESGYFEIERTDFDISALIDRVLNKYEPMFREREIKITADKEDIRLVNGDPVKLEQVLQNYLNNALNHVDEAKEINITLQNTEEKARVTVFNSGRPIPGEALEKIWTSFYKVDKARTRAYGGTGLGLSIVRAIQELHHNGYGAVNQEEGVEFWFDVDLAKPPAYR